MRLISILIFSILVSQSVNAVIKLPPVTIESAPKESKDSQLLNLQTDSNLLGTVRSEDDELKYLGTHWHERFSPISLWGITSQSLEIPALDLDLMDLRFFDQISESIFASHLTLNLYPTKFNNRRVQALYTVGTDLSTDIFYRHDIKAKNKHIRIQVSEYASAENRSYYDDRQTFFTPDDDQILFDPRTGTLRFQTSVTYQQTFSKSQFNGGILYSQKQEAPLPYPPKATSATLFRKLLLSHGQIDAQSCALSPHGCLLMISFLGYHSLVKDPDRDLFLGFSAQDLNHGTLAATLQLSYALQNFFRLEPSLHLQWGYSLVKTTSLIEENSELNNLRFQLSPQLTGVWARKKWQLQPSIQATSVLESLQETKKLSHLITAGNTVSYYFSTKHHLWFHSQFSQRQPTFFEQFGSFGTVKGNPDLKPEDAWSFQVGSQHYLKLKSISVLLKEIIFYNRYFQLIHYQPNAQLVHIPQNIGSAEAWGSQASIQAQWNSTLNTKLKLNWTRPRERFSDQTFSLPGFSELGFLATQSAWFFKKTILFWTSLRFQKGMHFDPQHKNPFPNSWVVSTGLSWNLFKTPFRLKLDVHNLFNQLVGKQVWSNSIEPLTLPVLERWGLPQRGRVIFLSLELANEI